MSEQVLPVNPSVQLHLKESIKSMQVPLFSQGLGRQSSMLISQSRPKFKLSKHRHTDIHFQFA